MIVCLCAGVNDRTIREVKRDGASTIREIGAATGAGTHCGSCCCDLRRLVSEDDRAPTPAGCEPRVMVLRR